MADTLSLDELIEIWEKDSNFDVTTLELELASIGKLYSKYYKLYSHEKILLNECENQVRILSKDKTEFYLNGATDEQRKLGWVIPQNRILKSEVPMYLASDKELNKLNRIRLQLEIKVDYLKSILKQIDQRQYQIKYYMDALRLKLGN